VHIEDLGDQLEHLRMEALLNSLVETDVASIRAHLLERFRAVGVSPDGNLKVWKLRTAVLQAEQICLSRLQIHALFCLAEPDEYGDVDLVTYMGSLSVVIPHMCDAKVFVETAERLQSEHADATRRNENAELAALGANTVDQLRQEDGEEKHQENEVDQETVERTLIQVFSVLDKEHNGLLAPETIWNVLSSGGDAQVQALSLSEFETNGLAAEMALDENGLVVYHEHVRRWVPVIFEVRKSPLLGGYLKDDSAETLGIPEPNIEALEALFPTFERQVHADAHKDTLAGLDHSFSQDHRGNSKEEHRGSMMAAAPHLRSKFASNHGHHGHHDKHGEGHGEGHGHGGHHEHHGHHGHRHPTHHHHGRKDSKSINGVDAPKEPPPGRGYARRCMLVNAARSMQAEDSRSAVSIGSKSPRDNIDRRDSKDSLVPPDRRPSTLEAKPTTPLTNPK
jgi:hypothetical protein